MSAVKSNPPSHNHAKHKEIKELLLSSTRETQEKIYYRLEDELFGGIQQLTKSSSLKDISINALLDSIHRDLHKDILRRLASSVSKRTQEETYYQLNDQLNEGIFKLHEPKYLIILTGYLERLGYEDISEIYYSHSEYEDDLEDEESLVMDILAVGENKKTSSTREDIKEEIFHQNPKTNEILEIFKGYVGDYTIKNSIIIKFNDLYQPFNYDSIRRINNELIEANYCYGISDIGNLSEFTFDEGKTWVTIVEHDTESG